VFVEAQGLEKQYEEEDLANSTLAGGSPCSLIESFSMKKQATATVENKETIKTIIIAASLPDGRFLSDKTEGLLLVLRFES